MFVGCFFFFIYSSFTTVTSQGRGSHSVTGTACCYLQEILGQMSCKEMLVFISQVARFITAIISVDVCFFLNPLCCLVKGRKRLKSIAAGTISGH